MYIQAMAARRYTIAEARNGLPSIIREAEAGVEIELTRRGKSVAVMMSIARYEKMSAGGKGFGEAYGEFVRRYPPAEVGIDQDFFRSIRKQSQGREVDL